MRPWQAFFPMVNMENLEAKTGKYDYHNNTCCLVALKEK